MSRGDVNAAIGENVHRIMWRRRLSQQQLGAQLGLTQQAVSRKVRGVRAFGVDELLAVAAWLDVPLDELLPGPGVLPRVDSNHQPAGYWCGQVGVHLARAA